MKKVILSTLAASVLSLTGFHPSARTIDPAPVNSDATEAARQLYDLLLHNYGKRVLTGAVAEDARDFQNADYIRNISGHYPVINCSDYIQHYQSAPVNPSGWSTKNYSDPSADAEWAAAGGIISYQWHWRTPSRQSDINNFNSYYFYCNGAGGSYEGDSNFSLANAMNNASSWERQVIDRDLDAIGGYLKNMQDKGLAVLWRPLHEAAGNYDFSWGKAWFWWGNSGPEPMKWLWKYMFDRFHSKGINNLIWVWTSTGNIDTNWYPGDDYVDIIGVDYYENDASKYRNSLIGLYNKLLNISSHKMLALTECGSIPSIENMKSNGDMWSYVVPWSGEYTRNGSYNPKDFLTSLYASDAIAHHDNIGNGTTPVEPDKPVVNPTGTVLWEDASNPALMEWNSSRIQVPAAKASAIKAGDKLVATVTRINTSGWPKFIYADWNEWNDIHQVDVYNDRGAALPKDYTFTVEPSHLSNLHKGFVLKGENCYISRLTHISNSSTGIDVPEACADADTTVNVYSLQGILLRTGVNAAEATRGLPAGLYIVGGRKVLVR